MRLLFNLVLGLVLGFVLGFVVTVTALFAYGDIAGVSQREGAYAMGVMFGLGPAGGVAGAAIGAVIALRRSLRARRVR